MYHEGGGTGLPLSKALKTQSCFQEMSKIEQEWGWQPVTAVTEPCRTERLCGSHIWETSYRCSIPKPSGWEAPGLGKIPRPQYPNERTDFHFGELWVLKDDEKNNQFAHASFILPANVWFNVKKKMYVWKVFLIFMDLSCQRGNVLSNAALGI